MDGCVVSRPFNKKGAKRERIELLRNEAEIYLQLDHPNIARLIEIYEDEQHVFMVMEYCSGKELYHRLCEKQMYKEQDAAEVTKQMLDAIYYLHSHSIVHRDLKLENWLYESEADDAYLKLIDFGFSKIWNPRHNRKMHATCGSLAYVSPDTLSGSYTNACDMWSLGVIVYMLLVGYPPFYGSENEILDKIAAGKYSLTGPRWPKVSRNAKDFVRRLLEVDPNKRMTAKEALDHVWITERVKAPEVKIEHDALEGLKSYAQSSHLKRAALTMMAYSLTSEEIEGMRELFKAIDKSREGTIRLEELTAVMQDHMEISNDEIEKIFSVLDHNKDEQVYYTDFLAAMLSTRIRLHEDLIRRAFERFDIDNSGVISVENLKGVLGDNYDGAAVEEIVKMADIDGNGTIDYEEFLAAVTAASEWSISETMLVDGPNGNEMDRAKIKTADERLKAVAKFLDKAVEAEPSRRELIGMANLKHTSHSTPLIA
mmetsp:Transcript_35012/g.100712  ORF Transcript_35012/g.100712 Transcript_35012/m.100712 type:complete len:484 (+) Transcript_35012:407-1858(+)